MDIERLAKPSLAGLRPYAPGKPVEVVQRERQTTQSFIKLASNENPYPPHQSVRDAIMRELSRQGNRYPESGCYYLVHALAGQLGVPPGDIFVGNGSNEILDLLMRAFVAPGENCIFPYPSFVVYPMICRLGEVEGVSVANRDEFYLDLKAIRTAVDEKTKIVFLCNPNNPTGTYYTAKEFDTFLSDLPERVLVVVDEAYFEYVTARDYPESLKVREKRNTIIILRTFSKMYSLASVRIGYAIADPVVVQCLHKVRQPFNVNRIAQAAALASLEHREEIFEVVRETIRERETVRERLLELECTVPPSQTNFLYVVPPERDYDFCDALLDRGVIVRNMRAWGGGANTFRVTLGTPDENARFLEAIAAILRS